MSCTKFKLKNYPELLETLGVSPLLDTRHVSWMVYLLEKAIETLQYI